MRYGGQGHRPVQLCLILLCLGLSLPLQAAGEERTKTAAAHLTDQLKALQKRHQIPVLAVHVARSQQPPLELLLGAEAATPLRWGSITKTVTALTVLALADRGKVSLHAPLSRYVDKKYWGNPWRSTHPVRVIDLLEMRAGFPDLSAREFAFNEPITLQQALDLNPGHRTSRWPPGTQHVYSNMTAGLTQLLIERVTRQPFALAAQRLVLAPLAMQQAGFEPRTDLPGGFRADGRTPIPYWHMTFPAYGALNAPLQDMTKLLRYLQPPGPLPHSVRQHLYTPNGRRWASQFTFDYAAGLYPRIRRGRVWHTHGGDADGYRSRLALLADGSGGYVVNINTDNPSALRQIERLLEAFLTADTPAPDSPAAAALSAAQIDAISGRYYPSAVRFGVDIWQQGKLPHIEVQASTGKVSVKRDGRTTMLYPVSATLFRRAQDPVATVTIFPHRGHVYLQGELGNYQRVEADAETPL